MQATQTISLATIPRKIKWGIFGVAFATCMAVGVAISEWYYWRLPMMGLKTSLIMVAIALVATIVLHEALHGLFFWIFGGQVKFGAKAWTAMGPVFWATSDKLLSKRQYQIVCLAPQILTAICLLLIFTAGLPAIHQVALWIIAVGNLCGGGFDIYISILVGRFSAGAKYRDMKDGLIVYE